VLRNCYKIFSISLVFFLLFAINTHAEIVRKCIVPAPRILFDDAHGQSFGNADWTPEHAYSDFADDLRKAFEASVFSLGRYDEGLLTSQILANIDLLIIPEPNIRYTEKEIYAVRRFVSSGGSLYLIADHGGSDRNFDGWDASLILNELTDGWGMTFLGDSFSETPIRGRKAQNSSIVKNLRAIGAWAATSIIIDKDSWHWVPVISSAQTGFPFLVFGEIGAGRILAIGDSSAFDDGSGDDTKNRHSAYHSWMFSQQRLAIQSVGWLLNMEPNFLPETVFPFPDVASRNLNDPEKSQMIIESALGNNDSDLMDRFGHQIHEQLDIPISIKLSVHEDFHARDILIFTNPSAPVPDDYVKELTDWVKNRGGRLIITGASARNPLSNIPDINHILETMGSEMRLNADQMKDPESNTGKSWSPKIPLFISRSEFDNVHSAVFWGCASVVNTKNKRLRDSDTVSVLAWSSINAYSEVRKNYPVKGGKPLPDEPKIEGSESDILTMLPPHIPPKAIPVAAIEKIGKGHVILLGADPFTNFQYPTETEKASMSLAQKDHTTPEFNLALLKILKNL